MTVERLRFQYDYERWANERILGTLRKASNRGAGLRLFGHLLAAQEVWLTRLWGQDSSGVVIWPERSLEECEAALERLAGELRAYLDANTDESLKREIVYRTQDGTEWRNTPLDILTHLSLHGQHHRGQITWELRKLGEEALSSDMILYLRR